MFWNCLLLGAVAGVDPARMGAVAFMLTRKGPLRLLVAYFVGGFGVSLAVGVVVLFLLKDVGIGGGSSVPPEIEIAVGALSLIVAVVVGSGLSERFGKPQEKLPAQAEDAGVDKLAAVEKVPGLGKLAPRVKEALASESPWLAWIAGVAIGLPSAYYLGAIAIILKSGVAAGTQVAALLVFNAIAFAIVVIPIFGYLAQPDATRERVSAANVWVAEHRRLTIAALAGGIGAYLLVVGMSKL